MNPVLFPFIYSEITGNAITAFSWVEIFNVESDDQGDTNTIARIIHAEVGLERNKICIRPNRTDGGGWLGDITNMLLSTDKIKNIGWEN